jgi:hypothetical protein
VTTTSLDGIIGGDNPVPTRPRDYFCDMYNNKSYFGADPAPMPFQVRNARPYRVRLAICSDAL